MRVRYPLLDVGLFRSGGFSAAAATVFLTGIALFGSMILLPLYYQIARGESPLIAGLLVAPQGLGAAIGMNLGGRATDRFGGGRVVVVGLIFLLAGTAIFTQVGATTSYWLIGVALVLRGLGLGGSMMPAMAGGLRDAHAQPGAARDPGAERAPARRRVDRRRAAHRDPAEPDHLDARRGRAGRRVGRHAARTPRAPAWPTRWPRPSRTPTGSRWASRRWR